jgi:hypothetical protein
LGDDSDGIHMTFRELSARILEPASMLLMILGIVALCQPWIEILHRYGVTITLVGLVGFSVFSKIKPLPREEA